MKKIVTIKFDVLNQMYENIAKLEKENKELKSSQNKVAIEKLEELKKELADLKQNAIVPKFKIGDTVYLMCRDVKEYMTLQIIQIGIDTDLKLIYKLFEGEYGYWKNWYYNNEFFATKEEAEAELKKLEE